MHNPRKIKTKLKDKKILTKKPNNNPKKENFIIKKNQNIKKDKPNITLNIIYKLLFFQFLISNKN